MHHARSWTAGIAVAGSVLVGACGESESAGPTGPDRYFPVAHYVEFYHAGFSVLPNGRLEAEVNPGERTLLNILPAFGRNASFSVDARWSGADGAGNPSEGASFIIKADWRYRRSSPWVDVHVSFDSDFVSLRNLRCRFPEDCAWRPFDFQPGEWYTFAVERAGEELVVSVSGTEMLRTTLQPKSGVLNVPEDGDVGGFGLMLEGDRDFRQWVQFDNLQIAGDRSPREYQAHITPFMIESDEYLYSVIYEAGFEPWAQGDADGSIPVLEAASRLYGVPPLSNRLGTVQARGEYFASGYGFNRLGIIEQQGHDRPVGPPRHELAHNWQHLYSKRWNTEGSAEFARRAIQEADNKVLTTADNLGLKPHLRERFDETQWGSEFLLDDDRVLTFVDLPTDDYWRGFWKSEVFTLVIYRILGPSGYRELHREALALGHGMNSEEMKAIMERILGRDLTDVFAGWVYPGQSVFPIEGTFSDSDGDGLGDLDELLMGTDVDRADTDGDGHRDRREIAAGFNPLDPGDVPPPSAIVIDGDGADWSAVATAAEDAREEVGDADFKAFRFVGNATDRTFHVRVDYWRAFVEDRDFDSHATVDFDLDGNGDYDYRVNLFFQIGVSNAFLTRGFASRELWDDTQWTGLSADGVQVAFGEEGGFGFVEASIPWDLFEAPSGFEVSVSGGSQMGADRLDASPVSVAMNATLPELPRTVWTPRR